MDKLNSLEIYHLLVVLQNFFSQSYFTNSSRSNPISGIHIFSFLSRYLPNNTDK